MRQLFFDALAFSNCAAECDGSISIAVPSDVDMRQLILLV